MIEVTRLKGQVVAINPDLIESVEETPDTTVRLTSGDTVLVRESLREIVERVIQYRRCLMAAFGTDPSAYVGRRSSTVPPAPANERR